MLSVIPEASEGHLIRKCPSCREVVIDKKFPDDPPESVLLICLCSSCIHHNRVLEDRYQFYDKYGFLLKYTGE